MGLFGKKRAIEDGVRAEARILLMAPTPKGARQTGKRDIEFEFRLDVGGREVGHTCVVPHAKMPAIGQHVPVEVSPTDPEELRILFEETPDLADRARASAAAASEGDEAGAADALGYRLKE